MKYHRQKFPIHNPEEGIHGDCARTVLACLLDKESVDEVPHFYAEFDGFNLIIYTHNGISRTNEVYLEPECLRKLDEYCKEIENVRS